MGLLRRHAEPAFLDPLLGDPAAHAVRQASQDGDMEALASTLSSATGDHRSLLLEEAVASHLPLETARTWTAQEPDLTAAWLCEAAVLAHLAAEARGGAMYEQLSTGQVLDFAQGMADARRAVERALTLDPDDSAAWSILLRTDYAGDGKEVREHVRHLLSRDADHVIGICTAVDLLGEKWFGEPGEARDLMEQVLAQAPDGSHAQVMVPEVLRAEWFFLGIFRDAKNLAAKHVREHAEELGTALDRSLRSPQFRPRATTPIVRNSFAHACDLTLRKSEAREQFDALNGLATASPWHFFGDPLEVYIRIRKKA